MGSQALANESAAIGWRRRHRFEIGSALTGGSMVVSTYQAGKVAMIGWDGLQVTLLMRAFDKPMGMAVSGRRLVLATRHDLWILADRRRWPTTTSKANPAATTPFTCRGRRNVAIWTFTTWRCWTMRCGWSSRDFVAWQN